MINIKSMLAQSIEHGASDIHINVGMPPIMRINTELILMDLPVVSDKDAKQMVLDMIGPEKLQKFEEKKDLDFSAMIDDGSRFRVNAHYQRDTIAISFRVISNQIPEIEDLHLPDIVRELTDLPRGLVLVTGHTGSGKSTSLAAMINVINRKYRKRIITLEDPIEYLLENRSSMIEQREIGADCPSFASGLKHVLRQDPDIILVGEMRDMETISLAVEAANTGHLVFSTLHTTSAAKTVDRIIEVFPPDEQGQIRSTLADGIRAILSQTLLKRIDRPGRVAALEIMIATPAVRNLIREAKTYQLPSMIQTGKKYGMQLLDDAIMELLNRGVIGADDGYLKANDKARFRPFLKSQPTDFTEV